MRHRPLPRRAARGFSLVELLVAVTIGLVISLALFGVLTVSEGRKRTLVSLNDSNQSGAYATYLLDRAVRSAGTGYAQGWTRVGGCRLNAVLPDSAAWPRATALPAPFAGLPQTMRLAPLVIFPGASAGGSDVLLMMSGTSGFSEAPTAVLPSGISAVDNEVRLPNTIGYRANDLVLLSGGGECMLTQVAAAQPACGAAPLPECGQELPLGGTYHSASVANTSLSALAGLAAVDAFSIGNSAGNPPLFQAFGVGADSTLFGYDLLLMNGSDEAVPVAEGVRELHAVYGLDSNDDGIRDAWQAPTVASGWDGATLMNGSTLSNSRLRQIVAVRIGLVMRSALVEREVVAPQTLSLFTDLPVAAQVEVDLDVAGQNRNQRHRTIEITVPVRNLLMRTTS